MKDRYKTLSGDTIERELVIFEAQDVNDPAWEPIITCLRKNGFNVCYANNNYMNIVVKEKRTCQKAK